MPNLFFKLDIETEVFANEKIKDPLESIDNIVLRYSGFTDVEHEYDIHIDANDFMGDCDIEINSTKPYNVKIRGLAKIKSKQDLFLNILEDQKPNIYLLEIHANPFEILATNKSKTPQKMICEVSSKKLI